MDDIYEPRDEIVQLEARIEELAGIIESCRKFVVAARAAMVLGAALLAALLFGVLRFDLVPFIAALAAVIGGIVLFGSNGSTRSQAEAELRAAEARRADLIGRIAPRVVGGTDTLH
jgi:hypothetical protein